MSSCMFQRPSQSSNPRPSVGKSRKLSRRRTWTRASLLLPRLDRLQARMGFFNLITLGRVCRSSCSETCLCPKETRSSTRPACRWRLQFPSQRFVGWRASHVPGFFFWTRHSFLFPSFALTHISLSATRVQGVCLQSPTGSFSPPRPWLISRMVLCKLLYFSGPARSAFLRFPRSEEALVPSCLVLTSLSWTTLRRCSFVLVKAYSTDDHQHAGVDLLGHGRSSPVWTMV